MEIAVIIQAAALIIGYIMLSLVALIMLVFVGALGWYAITEARTSIYASKWRKRKMKQMELETAIACAEYLCRYKLPADWSIYSIQEYFYNKLKKRNNNGKSETNAQVQGGRLCERY